jgi:hypothetical protein
VKHGFDYFSEATQAVEFWSLTKINARTLPFSENQDNIKQSTRNAIASQLFASNLQV